LLQRCVCDSLHDQLEKLQASRHPPRGPHTRRLIPL
jgi:hypothetical protein